jgi:hypothetical protein
MAPGRVLAAGLWALASGCLSDQAPSTDAGPCGTEQVALAEDFESYADGATLAGGWEAGLEGPHSAVRANHDAEGHGADGSARWLILLNDGSTTSVTLTATTPPVDLRRFCSARLDVQLIVFSLEPGEQDGAVIELAANGQPFTEAFRFFPSQYFFQDVNCRPGGQEGGCVAWMPFSIDIPPDDLASDLRARFRLNTVTTTSDAIGVDQVRLGGRR